MEPTHEDIKNMMADHYELVEELLEEQEAIRLEEEASRWAQEQAEAWADALLLDRFEYEWGDF